MGLESVDQVLSRLRAAAARADRADASLIFEEIEERDDARLATRACVHMALLYHRTNLGAEAATAERWLRKAQRLIADCRSRLHERDLGGEGTLTEPRDLEEIRNEYLETQLQLARAWQRLDRLDEAGAAYEALLRELDTDRKRSPLERHILAIAEYRLADLRVEEVPSEAYERWRRVFEMRDEEVSPYAAFRMAIQIGSSQLVGQRVERLFHYAMVTSDPRLYAEAALGLARHLKERNEFQEARRFFKVACEVEDYPELAAVGAEELEKMGRYEKLVKVRRGLRRPQQIQAKAQRPIGTAAGSAKRVIVVGAGKGGSYLLESLDARRYTVCGFVDDSATELPGHPEHPILGRIDDLDSLIRDLRPDEVLLAIPTLSGERRRQVVHSCRQTMTPLLNLPGVHELGIGWTRKRSRTSLMNQLRRVKVAETLGGEQRTLDSLATSWLQFSIVLVIGAGAIGAELCRRLADAEIALLVVIDKRESALKKIETELREMREFLEIEVRLGDARKPGFLNGVIEECAPYIIFNAIGDSSALAFEEDRLATDPRGWQSLFDNEVGAAWWAARAAGELGVPQVVHISSRRAGRGDDPLGALKLLCEELVLSQEVRHPETIYAVVRLGPLLDSLNGPFATMERQIRGGAVVTLPSATLSANFIPTARCGELVLHAGRLAMGGELFEPVAGVRFSPRSVAREAIELAGLYVDDVVIDETKKELWDEPRSPIEGEDRGDPVLGMKALERPRAGDEALSETIKLCAAVLDRHVSRGSGETAALVLARMHHLCGNAELVP